MIENHSRKCGWNNMIGKREGVQSTIKNRYSTISLIKVRAAQIKPALRTLQLAPALAQLRRTIRTVLPRISRLRRTPRPLFFRSSLGFLRHIFSHAQAARSFTASAVQLLQSAAISHAPSRRQTRTYLPRCCTGLPPGLGTKTEKFPNSIAISPE